jgi:hypothetical protein
MERFPNISVSAARLIGVAACNEKLTATSRAFRSSGLSHPPDRQKGKQNEVDQREQEALGKSAKLLERNPAGQSDVLFLDKRDHASKSTRGEPYIRIKKDQIRMRGVLSEHRAGMLLTAPIVGKEGRTLQS